MNVNTIIPGIQAIAMLDDKRIVVLHNGRHYRLFKDKIMPLPEELDESRILRAVASQAPEVCEAVPPGKTRKARLTRCDLIVLLGIVRRPDKWDQPFDGLCRRLRRRRAIETLTTAVRSTYRAHRDEYQYKQIEHPFTGIRPRLTMQKINHLCKEAISTDYIQNIMLDPTMKMLIAVRRVPSSFPPECPPPACYRSHRMKRCAIPRPIDIYRSKESAVDVSTVSFAQFKRMINQKHPDPTERAMELCKMPRKPVIGGFALIKEAPESITVFILCSNRSIGKNMLDHLKSRRKIVYIDHPLPDVISFYQKSGFGLVDEQMMAWIP